MLNVENSQAIVGKSTDSLSDKLETHVDWSYVKPIPTIEEQANYISASDIWSFMSSDNFKSKKFNPFESFHNSSFFEVRSCCGVYIFGFISYIRYAASGVSTDSTQ